MPGRGQSNTEALPCLHSHPRPCALVRLVDARLPDAFVTRVNTIASQPARFVYAGPPRCAYCVRHLRNTLCAVLAPQPYDLWGHVKECSNAVRCDKTRPGCDDATALFLSAS